MNTTSVRTPEFGFVAGAGRECWIVTMIPADGFKVENESSVRSEGKPNFVYTAQLD